jgi:hypothetical protein
MENVKVIELSTTGSITGKPYIGTFRAKGILTRRDQFLADATRRRIIGPNPSDALPALQGEAYMLGQLSVRIVEAPDWWLSLANGELIEDSNVIAQLYEKALEVEAKVKEEISSAAQEALKSLTKEPEKAK